MLNSIGNKITHGLVTNGKRFSSTMKNGIIKQSNTLITDSIGDVLIKVVGPTGAFIGTVIYASKFSNDGIPSIACASMLGSITGYLYGVCAPVTVPITILGVGVATVKNNIKQ